MYIHIILEFLCLGGWEEEIPYSSLPGTTHSSYRDREGDTYFPSSIGYQNGNGRSNNYDDSNLYTEQMEEDDVRLFSFLNFHIYVRVQKIKIINTIK